MRVEEIKKKIILILNSDIKFEGHFNKCFINLKESQQVGLLNWIKNCKEGKINRNPFPIVFDSRTFTLPEAEVNNYFISRQNDCERNAIQMIGQSYYSSKQLNGKKCKDIIKMINEDNNIIKKYDDYSIVEKMGYVFGNSKNYMGEFMCKFKEIGEGIINSLLEQEEI